MFKHNRMRDTDPFRLSALGRCRAAAAWLRGPTLMRRWMLLPPSLLCAICAGASVLVIVVMQPASSTQYYPMDRGSRNDLRSRLGPTSSEVTALPGYECQPMPHAESRSSKPSRTGPEVVAMDENGVLWGPACVVTYGLAGK